MHLPVLQISQFVIIELEGNDIHSISNLKFYKDILSKCTEYILQSLFEIEILM